MAMPYPNNEFYNPVRPVGNTDTSTGWDDNRPTSRTNRDGDPRCVHCGQYLGCATARHKNGTPLPYHPVCYRAVLETRRRELNNRGRIARLENHQQFLRERAYYRELAVHKKNRKRKSGRSPSRGRSGRTRS